MIPSVTLLHSQTLAVRSTQRSALLLNVFIARASTLSQPSKRIPLPQLYRLPFEDRLNYINSKQESHRRPTHLHALFRGATTSEDLQQAFKVFKTMRESLIFFDPEFYTEVVRACIKLKETSPVMELMNLPPNARIYPSPSSLVLLLRHFYAVKDLDTTKKLHQILLEKHPNDLSGDYYYEHIHWCRKQGLLEDALSYWAEFCASKHITKADRSNITYEVAKVMAQKGDWNSILSLDNPRNKASIVRMKAIASLKLGDSQRAIKLLVENANLSPLSLREDYVTYCVDIKPTLASVLNQIIEQNNELFGDSAELLLLQLQEE